jgi:hypothetical protein
VSKAVSLVGAGRDQTILDGGGATGLAQSGTLRVDPSGGDDVRVSGMTIRDAAAATNGSYEAIAVKGVGSVGRTYRFTDVEVEGRGSNFDKGLFADHGGARLVFEDSAISGTGGNPIVIERYLGPVDIRDNDLSSLPGAGSAIFLLSYAGDRITSTQLIRDNRITNPGSGIGVSAAFGGGANEGGFRDVQVIGNTIDSGGSGITLTNGSNQSGGANGAIENTIIRGNRLAGQGTANTRGVNLTGGVIGTQIAGNTISGYPIGLRFANSAAGAHSQSGTSAPFNRIVGNGAGTTNLTSLPVDAENTWWGCNGGPGTAGCDTSDVDSDPWLVFGASASPSSIHTGGETSTITAGPLTNSDGATPADNAFPDATPIAFSTDLGDVPASALTAGARAQAPLTSGAAGGLATVTATLDNASATAPVTFTAPPAPTNTETTRTVTNTVTNTVLQGAAPSLIGPGDVRLLAPRTTEVFPSGRFVVAASVTGGGRLLARGTATTGQAAAVSRLAGRAFSVTRTQDVRIKMRLNRAARRAIRRGRAVTARVTVTLTPRSGAPAVTKTVRLPLKAR